MIPLSGSVDSRLIEEGHFPLVCVGVIAQDVDGAIASQNFEVSMIR